MDVFAWIFVLLALASLGLFIVVQPHGHRVSIPAGAVKFAALVILLVIALYLALRV